MTISEYTNKMEERWHHIITTKECYSENDKDVIDMYKFQRTYMTEVIDNYAQKSDANEYVLNILKYIRDDSLSGSCCEYVKSKGEAETAEKILNEEFTSYLLEPVDVYKEDSWWCVDCIFGGFFVPAWEGFEEEFFDEVMSV